MIDDFRKYKSKDMAGGWSISKMFADGRILKRMAVRLEPNISTNQSSFHEVIESQEALNGTLTLEDLNRHRLASGEMTKISEAAFDNLRKCSDRDFGKFDTDPIMNFRRNSYLYMMCEVIKP